MRCLRAVLQRTGVAFDPPFRDYNGFHGYWSRNGMSGTGGWAARRGYLNDLFSPVLSSLDAIDDPPPGFRGVDGTVRNIIFASTGPKPEIVLRDATTNLIEITKNAEFCLFYNQAVPDAGLTWGDLVSWWKSEHPGASTDDERTVKRQLYQRLQQSLAADSPGEHALFTEYHRRFQGRTADRRPALLPQVYLHFNPKTRRQYGDQTGPLQRERMDFLLLLPGAVRVVLEVDGRHHYANGDVASPQRYADMVAEDRALRLRGYEVFRFGSIELTQPDSHRTMARFFDALAARYALSD